MLHCEGGFATDDRRRASRVVGVRTYGLVMVGGQSVTSVERGLALLAAGMEELLAATAAPLETPQLLLALRALEVARRRVSAVDHQVLSQAAEQGAAVQLGHRTLHQVLRISERDARARIRAAGVCGPRRAVIGPLLSPIQPCTAAAAHDGLIGVEHTRIIDPREDPGRRSRRGGGARREIVGRVRRDHEPGSVGDGRAPIVGAPEPGWEPHRCRRPRPTARPEPGTPRGEFDVRDLRNPDPELSSQARCAVREVGRSGAGTEHAADPHPDVSDPRSQAQRNHDALEKLCDLVLGDARGRERLNALEGHRQRVNVTRSVVSRIGVDVGRRLTGRGDRLAEVPRHYPADVARLRTAAQLTQDPGHCYLQRVDGPLGEHRPALVRSTADDLTDSRAKRAFSL